MTASTYCGLDFGTSNSTIGVSIDGNCQLVMLENNKPTLRSAIFYNSETKTTCFGNHAINEYLNDEPGRLMMSLKSVLGSSLMSKKTVIQNKLVPYSEVLGSFIAYMKHKAEEFAGQNIDSVVMGRPVRFHDNDSEKDQLAQDTLEDIALKQGFKNIIFKYEPFAAGLTYEKSLAHEELALIVDMGGGTSDFTVIKLSPGQKSSDRSSDVLSYGGIHIGGNNFDKQLSLMTIMPLLGMGTKMRGSSCDLTVPSSFYFDLTTWHTLRQLYENSSLTAVQQILAASYDKPLIQRLLEVLKNKQGHRILHVAEEGKKLLSTMLSTTLDLDFIEEELQIEINSSQFNQSIHAYRAKLLEKILSIISKAGIRPDNIQTIFYTGGSSQIPIIQSEISNLCPKAKHIFGDMFGSVGLGLTLAAQMEYESKQRY